MQGEKGSLLELLKYHQNQQSSSGNKIYCSSTVEKNLATEEEQVVKSDVGRISYEDNTDSTLQKPDLTSQRTNSSSQRGSRRHTLANLSRYPKYLFIRSKFLKN